jgi:hypothetical protein
MRTLFLERMKISPWVVDGLDFDISIPSFWEWIRGKRKSIKISVPGLSAEEVDEMIATLNLEQQDAERQMESSRRDAEISARSTSF